MDEMRKPTPPAHPLAPTSSSTPDDVAAGAPQPVLPFDDASEEPIGYALTARARRTVAPDALPSLAVVPIGDAGVVHARPGASPTVPGGDPDLERPNDTRPARARALRRSGLAPAAIAAQLDADALVVDAWIADVAPPASLRRGAASVSPVNGSPAGRSNGGRPPGAAGSVGGPAPSVRGGDDQVGADDRAAFELARAAAAREVHDRLRTDPDLAAGVGMLIGLASTDPHAVTLTVTSAAVAGRLLDFFARYLGVEQRDVRIVVRPGPAVAGDLVRHRWARELGVDVERIAYARWRAAPEPDAVEAIVRIGDPVVAATVAGWCDALIAPPLTELDVAF